MGPERLGMGPERLGMGPKPLVDKLGALYQKLVHGKDNRSGR